MRALRLVALVLLAGPVQAEEPVRFETMDDARGWEAVGRLEIADRGFCTATLIAADVVLTAAHCLYDDATGERVDLSILQFRAGLRDGRALAVRGVRHAAIDVDYRFEGPNWTEGAARDLALLHLSQPIRTGGIVPLALADRLLPDDVGVVSYAHNRAEAPSLQQVCQIMGGTGGVLVLTCSVDYGSSGAPVFQVGGDGVARVVSVVSAKAKSGEDRVAIGASAIGRLGPLMAELQAASQGFGSGAPAGARVLEPGQRTDIGARFVRP